MERAIEVLPTPGGPAKSRIFPFACAASRACFGAVGSCLLDGGSAFGRRVRAGDVRLPGSLRFLPRLPELAHGEELEDPVLDVAQGVVVLVEDPRGLLDVQVVFAAVEFQGSSAIVSR